MLKLLLSFFVFLTLTVQSCKTSDSTPKIVNGIEDKDNKYPSVVRILVYEKDNIDKVMLGCSGSIISHNTIVTAAHCLRDISHDDQEKLKIKVRLNSGKDIMAKGFYFHDKYEQIYQFSSIDATIYDVGILVFEDHSFDGIPPVKISNYPLTVPGYKRDDIKIQLVGFAGQTDYVETVDAESGKKQISIVSVDTKDETSTNIRRYGANTLKRSVVCPEEAFEIHTVAKNASLDPKNRVDPEGSSSVSWNGDSGGAVLLWKNQSLLVGVISSGLTVQLSCLASFHPGVVDWLKKINKDTDALIPLDEIIEIKK